MGTSAGSIPAKVAACNQSAWEPMLVLSHLPPDSRHSTIPTRSTWRAEGRPVTLFPVTLASPLPTQQVTEGPVNRWASGHGQSSLPFSQQQRAIPCLISSQRGGDMPQVHSLLSHLGEAGCSLHPQWQRIHRLDVGSGRAQGCG